MAEVALQAETRTERGSAPARRFRASGRVPATLYGRGMEPVSLTVDARELAATLHTDAGMNVLIDLKVGSESHLALARELDRHPVKGTIIHVDLMKIAHDQQITVEVPISFEGTAPGVKEGGSLDHHTWHVTVSCLPTNVPERLVVDLSGLGLNDTIRVSDIVTPDGVVITSTPEEVVVACAVAQEMKLEAETEAGPAPEVAGAPAAEGAPAPATES